MNKENNPFLSNIFPPDFNAMTPEAADEAITFALNEARQNISKIEELPQSETNFENVIRALDNSSTLLDEVWNIANHIESVSSTPEMREVLNRRDAEVSDFSSSICINAKLWEKIKIVRDSGVKFEGEEKILLDETVRDFVENGANLNPEDKEKLRELDAKLSALTRKFSENSLDALNAFELHVEDKSELDGMPESALALARKKAEAKNLGGYLITLDAPVFAPIMSHCKNESLRKKLWSAYSELCSGGEFDNTQIMREIIETRSKKAELLGNKNFADYVLNSRMAHNGKTALDFIETLQNKIEPAFRKDISEIENFAGKSPIEPWNGAFYAENMRKEKYDFDSESFRPYITLDSAMQGAFSLAKSLYLLDIKKSEAPSWHDSVMFFDVFDENNRHIASFYADLFPRKGKRSGAWMNLFKQDTESTPKLGLIAANFNEASSGKPSLLNHDELSTLFHEFGHLLHFILMDCKERGLRDVAWDFVELPSQIMENWCNKKEVLDTFARHYETNAPLPEELFGKFDRARKFRAATACMRQLSFAKIDLDLHMRPHDFLNGDIEEKAQEALRGYTQKYTQTPRTILTHFTHIFGDPVGYAAGYYSYKWAEALDADAFTRFEKEGLFNRQTGKDFADSILKAGSSVPPEKAFENFMKRPLNPDALIKRTIG